MSHLTPRQERFAREYIVDRNGAQAAIRAGYSAKGASQQGSKLLALDKVRARVDELSKVAVSKTDMTVEWVLQNLRREALDAESNAGSRVRALELIGKYHGMFVDRVETRELGNKTDEELAKEVAEAFNVSLEVAKKMLETGEKPDESIN